MTQTIAGKLGGCPFTIVKGEEHPDDDKYVCLQCGMESIAERDAFLETRLEGHCTRIQNKGIPPHPAPEPEQQDEEPAEKKAEAPKTKRARKKSKDSKE